MYKKQKKEQAGVESMGIKERHGKGCKWVGVRRVMAKRTGRKGCRDNHRWMWERECGAWVGVEEKDLREVES